ncbi:MAG: isoprenylcysteine carboxylmethyltransferase family protein [Bacteroidales bacterium]|nr:isoprenylcysteine carboxylmethyltransferase family protein [Bacteroidales bacterium]MCF8398028.1 isoprenylcysteine carboxylmethyltransferase family protein [Bacteroidales bacterium]
MIPKLLVFFQFIGIALVILSGRVIPSGYAYFAISSLGVILGLWAIFEQKPGNFNITPTNKSGARFVTKGPYKYIRHPMYLAIIIAFVPLIIDHYNTWRLLSGFFLLIVLIIKLEYEEKKLMKQFAGYKEYKRRSWKILPPVY